MTPGTEEVGRQTLSRLLLWSTRYAMGRRSTAPVEVASLVVVLGDYLEDDDRATILRDYEEALRHGELGDPCDAREWAAMAGAIR